jgi:hypothetical protein
LSAAVPGYQLATCTLRDSQRLIGKCASIDREDMTGDHTGFVECEEERQVRDVILFDEAQLLRRNPDGA